MSRRLMLAATIPMLAACAGDPTRVQPDELSARFAKQSVPKTCDGGPVVPDSYVRMTWTSNNGPGIESDGGDYVGGTEGVKAKVFYHDCNASRSGDLVFDPDAGQYSPARKLVFRFPANSIGLPTTPVASGAAFNFYAIVLLGSDVTWDAANPVGRDAKIEAKYPAIPRSLEFPSWSAIQPDYPASNTPYQKFRILQLGVSGCGALEYDQIHLERTAGTFEQLVGARASDGLPMGRWTTAPGSWVVQSTGDHLAQCYTSQKGVTVANGAPMRMPFHVVITELR